MNKRLVLGMIALAVLAVPIQSAIAGDKPFPKIVDTLPGSYPEGFAIGKGATAYNGSPLGSIYKVDLRSGQGEVLVPVQDPDPFTACVILGMRVDPRTNYLFAAGCFNGNAFVYDADTGALIMEYQLAAPFTGVVNDLTITGDAVYFTDSYRPVLYRLPLSRNGAIPLDPGAATEIPLPPEFELDFENDPCCGGNGIVSTPDGKTLIIGHSNLARLYRYDTATGDVNQIAVDGPLTGFLDGIAKQGDTLYIMTPYDPPGPPVSIDGIQVVQLDKDYLSGTLVKTITDPDLDGVASGAIFGSSLYVNNARYNLFDIGPPPPDTPYWLTKLRIRPKK
jgi:sugar lactone lactonase YvrE